MSATSSADEIEHHIFSMDYLLRRPLLEAISQPTPPVLLIDEIDRADEEFEAFLLEILSDFQVTIPELGTIRAVSVPHVILTSNGTRALSDALRRRCLYSYLDFPDEAKELAILRARLPGLDERLGEQIVRFVQKLRREDLEKKPGIAETLDWASALMGLDFRRLDGDPAVLQASLACLLKTEGDLKSVPAEVTARLHRPGGMTAPVPAPRRGSAASWRICAATALPWGRARRRRRSPSSAPRTPAIRPRRGSGSRPC